MSHTANPTYLAETDMRIKSPNYFVVVKNWGGADRYIAMKPVQNPTHDFLIGLGNLKLASQTIAPEEGKSSIGSMGFSVQDKGDQITAMVANAIRHKQVELWAGYDGIDEANYIQLTANLVDDFEIAGSLIEYTFKTADIQRSVKKDIFKVKSTSLTAQLNAGATTATVAATAAFLLVNHPALGNVGYLRIEDEIIKWTASTATSFAVERGQFGTTDAQHKIDTAVKEVVVFQEHPIAIALKILMSTGAATNGTYDTLPAHWSLGIDQALIKISQWESEAQEWLKYNSADYTSGYQFRFILDGKEDGKKFIEEEILKVMNAYSPIDADGSLSFRAFSPPVPFTDLEKLDETTLNIKKVSGGLSTVINIALFEWDYDLVQGKHLTNIEYSDGQSISDHGESKLFTVSSRGLRSDMEGAAIVLERWNRLKQRYSKPVPTYFVKAFYGKHLLEIGELINFSHFQIPDIEAGTRGLTEKIVEIVNKGFDVMGGALHYDMMLTGFGRKYALYAPDSVSANYDAATEAEKNRYGFYADSAGKVGAADDTGYSYG